MPLLHKSYEVSLLVNNNIVDLPNDFNIELNAKLRNPESLQTKTSEFSYSFKLPITKKNCQILNYSNVISVPSKFVRTYSAQLVVDGITTYDGTIRISNVDKNYFHCNLVIIKVNTLDTVFGDATLNMIDWKVPFNGIPTINEVNADETTKYWFPLVSYGVFAKDPANKYNTFNTYTSIYSIDYTNKFYNSTFYPSLSLLEIVKKCFEYKGYTLEGSVLDDNYIKNIYMSCNLADEQQPTYNLGNALFGKAHVKATLTNQHTIVRRGETVTSYATGNLQDLKYGYCPTKHPDVPYDFNEISVYNLLQKSQTGRVIQDSGTGSYGRLVTTDRYYYKNTVEYVTNTYLTNDSDGAITIPADGLYKITLDGKITTSVWADESIKIQNAVLHSSRQEYIKTLDFYNTSKYSNFSEWRPIEIQVVKNYDGDIELIGGNRSWWYRGLEPDPSNSTEIYSTYPHEEKDKDVQVYPTEKIEGSDPTIAKTIYNQDTPSATNVHAYDPIINPNFICGMSTIGNTLSAMKNSYSWNQTDITHNDVRVNRNGYIQKEYDENDNATTSTTEYNSDTCAGATNTLSYGVNYLDGKITVLAYLNKNDRIGVYAISRAYECDWDGNLLYQTYPVSVNVDFQIEAMSPNNSDEFFMHGNNANSPSEFDVDLNLANFLNKETKISDFINDFQKAFNLSYQQIDNNVIMDVQKHTDNNDTQYAINIDDRVNIDDEEAEFSIKRIEYPASIAVQYSINTDEAGFYKTVPREKLQKDDWEEYGDKGYDVIQLNENGDAKKENITLKFSYCWYDDFVINEPEYGNLTDRYGNVTGITVVNSAKTSTDISIPVIAKSADFIDRGDIESYMQKDGYSLAPRLWFRNKQKVATLPTVYDEIDNAHSIDIYVPTNSNGSLNLNYKNQEINILEKYFNISEDNSNNYVIVSCYLNSIEYFNIKNGAKIIFDSDLYDVVDITKYSPMGNNKCTLTLIKHQ